MAKKHHSLPLFDSLNCCFRNGSCSKLHATVNYKNRFVYSIQSCILLVLLCFPTLLYAQTASAYKSDATPGSLMDRQVDSVPDSLSNDTEWINNHFNAPNAISQGKDVKIKNIVMLHFRVNSTLLDPSYMDNAKSLAIIDRLLSDSTQLLSNHNFSVILGSASPEGNTDLNAKLAQGRALATKRCIVDRHPGIDRDKIITYAVDEDWVGFRQMVVNDANVPNRNRIIQILDLDIPSKQKLDKIKSLNGGKAYRYIKANIFPALRGGVTFTFVSTVPQTPSIEYRDRVVEILRIDTIYIEKSPEVSLTLDTRSKKPFYFAIKTNLLYDLVLLPNLAVEFSLPRRWSVEVEGMESWWNTKDEMKYRHRIQTGGLELRKWLGNSSKTPLNGHFLGLYAMGGTYDVKYQEDKGLLSNMSYSAGITYGYAAPIARRFNLEFAIGLGYVGGDYKDYTFDSNRNCYTKVDESSRSYWGPTKAKISLVWLIGSGINTINKSR